MADIPQPQWSETALDNVNPAPDGWPPNSLPTIVYQTDREMMAAIKREWDRNNPTLTSGGSANAQTLDYVVNPIAYVQGMRFSFIAGFTNTSGATLEVGTLGPKDLFFGALPFSGGEIVAGQVVEVFYDGSHFQLSGSSSGTSAASTLQTFLASPVMGSIPFRRADLLTFDYSTARLEQLPQPASWALSGPDDRLVITASPTYYRLKASDWTLGPIIPALGSDSNTITIGIANIAINKPYFITCNQGTVNWDPGPLGTINGFGTDGTMMQCNGVDSFILYRLTTLGFWVIAAVTNFDSGESLIAPITSWWQNPGGKYSLQGEVDINPSGQGTFAMPAIFGGDTAFRAMVSAKTSATTDGTVYVLSEDPGTSSTGPTVAIKNTYTHTVTVRVLVNNLTHN